MEINEISQLKIYLTTGTDNNNNTVYYLDKIEFEEESLVFGSSYTLGAAGDGLEMHWPIQVYADTNPAEDGKVVFNKDGVEIRPFGNA